MLFLTHHDVRSLLDPAEVLRVAEEALRQAAAGAVRWSEPRLMTLEAAAPEYPARFRIKACALNVSGVVGTRVTGLSSRAPTSDDVPTRLVLLNDAVTGAFIGMVDERWSFAVRTGASAVLALRYLAQPGTHTVGIIGTGQVGLGTAYVLPAALPVKHLVVTDRLPEASARFARMVRAEQGIEVTVVESAEQVLAAADVVIIATTTPEPFVRTVWLRPGCTVCSLGGETEVELDAYTTVDKLVVDDWDAVRTKRDMRELVQQGLFDQSRVHANFQELVAGRRPGRETASERILVRSEGLAIMDTAISAYLCQKATTLGVGQRLAGA